MYCTYNFLKLNDCYDDFCNSDLNPVSRWLDVLGSTEHNICTLPINVAFADLNCDLDFKLVVADMGLTNNVSKLKVHLYTSSYKCY